MNEFEAFQIYYGIKQHFETSYDYVKYNGKTKLATVERFKKENKYYWKKFSKSYPQSFKFYCIAAFLNDGPKYIKELDSETYLCYYNTLVKNTSNLGLTFREDLYKYRDKTFKEVIKDYDCIKTFTPETLVILDRITGLASYHKLPKIKKYSSFFSLEVSDFKEIIKEAYPIIS